MKKEISSLLVFACISLLVSGCSVLSLVPTETVRGVKTTVASVASSTNQTYDQLLQSHSSGVIQGTFIAALQGGFTPDKSSRHYAFAGLNGRLIYVFSSSAADTWVVLLNQQLQVLQTVKFPAFKLNHAALNGKILYFDDGNQTAVKLNVDSGDYSKVSSSEMKLITDAQQVKNLNADESSLLQLNGYIFTNKGTIFDVKQQDYLPQYRQPGSAYPHAELADRTLLYSIEPRADGTFKLAWYEVKQGAELASHPPVIFSLSLPKNTPVDQAEYLITAQGDLVVFETGVADTNQFKVELFQIPLGSFRQQSTDESIQ